MKTLALVTAFMGISFAGFSQPGPKGLDVAATAPEFAAVDQTGKSQELKSMLKKGPVVLIFYRGQWCPYCNKQMKQLQDSLPQLTAKGASLVAITGEKPENITKTVSKTKATYPVLYDAGLNIMRSYDVAFAVDADTQKKLKGYGIDLDQANGSNGNNLPVPAVYVINKDGKIVYKHFDPDYTKRPSVAEILSNL
jgi:peroxiredoxin